MYLHYCSKRQSDSAISRTLAKICEFSTFEIYQTKCINANSKHVVEGVSIWNFEYALQLLQSTRTIYFQYLRFICFSSFHNPFSLDSSVKLNAQIFFTFCKVYLQYGIVNQRVHVVTKHVLPNSQ